MRNIIETGTLTFIKQLTLILTMNASLDSMKDGFTCFPPNLKRTTGCKINGKTYKM